MQTRRAPSGLRAWRSRIAMLFAFAFAVIGSPRSPSAGRESEIEERAPGAEDAPWEAIAARDTHRSARPRLHGAPARRELLEIDAHVEPGAAADHVPRPRWTRLRRGRAPPGDDDHAC